MDKNIKVFIDTNILLHTDNLDVLLEEYGELYLSSIVIEELESIKTDSRKDNEVKFKGRIALRHIIENEDKYKVILCEDKHRKICEDKHLEQNNDNLIIATAYEEGKRSDVKFISNDILAYKIAKEIFGLDSMRLIQQEDEYKGFKEFTGSTDDINELFYQYDSGNNSLNLLENEYLILKNTDLDKVYEYRFNNGELNLIKLPPSKVVKGWNSKQRCALDLLMDKNIPIKIIAGNFGSGKTVLSIRTAVYHILDKGNYSKIMLVRNPLGSGEEIGYLKGTKEDKIREFYKPIEQNLDGGEFQLNDMVMKGQLEMEIPYYMKGMSLKDTFVLVDECEDLNKKIFKLIGSRVGNNSCVAFVGDWKQAEAKYVHDNGLIQFIQYAKGNPLVGIVVLDEDVRSSASKLFADF
ncbi:TPA: PhoH family protein [Clostridium botulinum]|uniref:PhoH family protein n=1 Tax=Clostridium botulinum TaxID=1491 RepID=UPI0004652030|nr:PhoH family protein [Clostridium botulinum]APR02497.1 phoH-like family protein [Clostridium botulinum]AUN01636.1 hypothetical protein RSJ19_01275 [Clostridium botulinum]MBN3359358.1 hypothetical protein [Clostridium botulinum]MBN3367187.1 hypothetical protein [Clostridium botulinum]MBN3371820.1 hypothetical protein [Clostridium botulinum]